MDRRREEYEAELSEEELQRLKEYDQLIEEYDYRWDIGCMLLLCC